MGGHRQPCETVREAQTAREGSAAAAAAPTAAPAGGATAPPSAAPAPAPAAGELRRLTWRAGPARRPGATSAGPAQRPGAGGTAAPAVHAGGTTAWIPGYTTLNFSAPATPGQAGARHASANSRVSAPSGKHPHTWGAVAEVGGGGSGAGSRYAGSGASTGSSSPGSCRGWVPAAPVAASVPGSAAAAAVELAAAAAAAVGVLLLLLPAILVAKHARGRRPVAAKGSARRVRAQWRRAAAGAARLARRPGASAVPPAMAPTSSSLILPPRGALLVPPEGQASQKGSAAVARALRQGRQGGQRAGTSFVTAQRSPGRPFSIAAPGRAGSGCMGSGGDKVL